MSPTQSNQGRRTVFLSHAYPEDNAAAAWFATRLTLLGYDVWCDVRDSAGGESDFWQKVQRKIEDDSAKFVFLLSDTSRDFDRKKGVYKEVQAAANLNRDNFIIPISIAQLTGSVPILVGTDLYIDARNWSDGLRHLVERLRRDGVPLASEPDYEKITSWWPALYVPRAVASDEECDLVSTVLRLLALPERVNVLRVLAEGNILAGHERLRLALQGGPPFSAHKEFALSFGTAADYQARAPDFEVALHATIPTQDFLTAGWAQGGVTSNIALNMATYWIAASLEAFLASRGLSHKSLSWSSRKIWYVSKGLLPKDKHAILEPGRKKSPASLVGSFTTFKREYFWHFGVQPQIDLRTHRSVLLSPKAIITRPYDPRVNKPVPLDEKKVLRALSWWNQDWRRRTTAFSAWLASDQEQMSIPCGQANIVLSARPAPFRGAQSYRDIQDEQLMREITEPRS